MADRVLVLPNEPGGGPVPLLVSDLGRTVGGQAVYGVATATGGAAAGAPVAGTPTLIAGADAGGLTRVAPMVVPSDVLPLPSSEQLATAGVMMGYSGANLELWRTNQSYSVLGMVARTATTNSANQLNPTARGCILSLCITGASGTGGLFPMVYLVDPGSGLVQALYKLGTRITAIGLYLFIMYPADTPAVPEAGAAMNSVLPRVFMAQVNHGDASSYTYSLGVNLIL
jgi:hypothetical protein